MGFLSAWFFGRKTRSELIAIGSMITLALHITGCTKDDLAPTTGPDVYIAGSEGNIAKYWKNGMGVDLTAITDNGYSTATSIIVSGNDIYIAGSVFLRDSGDPQAAVYWKNGSPVVLPSGPNDSFASSIAIVGNDVYVAGAELDLLDLPHIAKYWKNGEEVILTDGSARAHAASIALSAQDVYVAGYEFNGTVRVAKYWRNGIPVILGHGTVNSDANGIAISGGDVYVVGGENGAQYWKNGNAVILADDGYASSITVSGNDVYVAGGIYVESHTVAVYWKNGVMVRLSSDADNANASSIAVLDNDTFVAGTFEEARAAFLKHEYPIAVCWKNGTAVPVTDGNETVEIHSIFIVR